MVNELDHDTALEINRLFEQADVSLCFKGDFNQSLLHAVLGFWESRRGPESEPVLKSRMFSLIIEAFQNISKHGARNTDLSNPEGIILVGKRDNKYFLLTGNCIDALEAETLKRRLDDLKALDKEELKKLHKSMVATTELSAKSCGSLGLINIIRKCNDFDYRFKKLSSGVNFFELEMII